MFNRLKEKITEQTDIVKESVNTFAQEQYNQPNSSLSKLSSSISSINLISNNNYPTPNTNKISIPQNVSKNSSRSNSPLPKNTLSPTSSNDSTNEIKLLYSKIGKLTKENKNLESRISCANEVNDKFNNDILTLTEKTKDQQIQIKKLKTLNNTYKTDISQYLTQNELLKKESQQFDEEQKKLENELKNLLKCHNAKIATLSECENCQILNLKISNLEKEYKLGPEYTPLPYSEDSQNVIENLNLQIKNLEILLTDKNKIIEINLSDIESINNQIEENKIKLQKISDENVVLNLNLENANKEIEKLNNTNLKYGELLNSKETKISKLSSHLQQLSDTEAKLAFYEKDKKDLERKFTNKVRECDEFTGAVAKIKTQMEKGNLEYENKISNLVLELEKNNFIISSNSERWNSEQDSIKSHKQTISNLQTDLNSKTETLNSQSSQINKLKLLLVQEQEKYETDLEEYVNVRTKYNDMEIIFNKTLAEASSNLKRAKKAESQSNLYKENLKSNNKNLESLKRELNKEVRKGRELSKELLEAEFKISKLTSSCNGSIKSPERRLSRNRSNQSMERSTFSFGEESCILGEDGDTREANWQYLKHVVLKFILAGSSERDDLFNVLSTVLHLTTKESNLLLQTLEYKKSLPLFGSKPKLNI